MKVPALGPPLIVNSSRARGRRRAGGLRGPAFAAVAAGAATEAAAAAPLAPARREAAAARGPPLPRLP